MWTAENRARYNRDPLQYPRDLTDKERGLIDPLIPPAKKGGGGDRRVNMREIVNGIMKTIALWTKSIPAGTFPRLPRCGPTSARMLSTIPSSSRMVGQDVIQPGYPQDKRGQAKHDLTP